MHLQPWPFLSQLFLDFCAIFFPEWPLICLVIMIHQVIWPSHGTLRDIPQNMYYSAVIHILWCVMNDMQIKGRKSWMTDIPQNMYYRTHSYLIHQTTHTMFHEPTYVPRTKMCITGLTHIWYIRPHIPCSTNQLMFHEPKCVLQDSLMFDTSDHTHQWTDTQVSQAS